MVHFCVIVHTEQDMRIKCCLFWMSMIYSIARVQGGSSCSRFGNDLVLATPAGTAIRSGTFVNVSTPISCPGNATRWNICYYMSSSSSGTSTTYLGVYRLMSGTTYALIPESSTSFSTPRAQSAYECSQMNITAQYVVKPGDILVVCVQQSGTRLGVAGLVNTSSILLDSRSCTGLPGNTIDIGSRYTLQSGLTLHVNLDVNECAVSNGGCEQICTDLSPGNSCSCYSGYNLDANLANCTDMIPPQAETSAGAIAGIVIVVLVTLAVIALVGLAILYYVKRLKIWKPSPSQGTINNVCYGVHDHNQPTVGHVKPLVQVPDMASHTNEGLLVNETQFCDPTYETTFQEEEQVHDDLGDPSPYCVPATQEKDLHEQIRAQKMRYVSAKEIVQGKELGHGQFGSVFKGHWNGALGHREVAIKTLNSNDAQPDTKVKFLQEAAIMAQFRHPNVIRLYGIVTEGSELMLIIELAEKGDLRNYLTSLKPDPGELVSPNLSWQLLNYSKQIAFGMQYLAEKSFVHRDLAARNILLAVKGTKHICKIADFGLSRDLADENFYVSKGGMVPLKWTAPEAIHYKKYSTASDVWSYGCLLYEIWSVGHKPFEAMGNSDVVEKVDSGYRLPPPPGCPLLIYQTMIQCWNPDANSRLQFRMIHLSLSQGEEHVLNIPNEALQAHPQAGVLGALLEAGQKMYADLQKTYLAPNH